MYQALYRKYKPLVFEDLVGQEHITSVLQNQIKSGQISHAYLFSGTRGTGKTSAAKIFARAVNCLSKDNKPCNKCDSCIENLQESAIDIVEIDAASNNGVDNIRDLKDRAFYQPASMKYKVYIIDEVHMLSKGAFNALLKILEEPPSHLIFILATTEPERIPLTILSRCQKFQFNRISPATIEKRLRYIADEEKIEMDDRVYKIVVSRADGSMRDALSIMDQLFTTGFNNIDYDLAIETLGIVNSKALFDLIDAIIRNSSNWIDILDEILNSGKDIEQLSQDILEHFRKLMIAKVSPNSIDRYIFTNSQMYIDQSKDIALNYITEAMNISIKNLNDSRHSTQKRALLEIAIIEVININDNKNSNMEINKTIDDTRNYGDQEKIEKNDHKILNNKRIEAKETTSPKENLEYKSINETVKFEKENDKKLESESDLSLDLIKKDWKSILNELKKLPNTMIHALLVDASVYDYSDGTLTLGFLPGYEFHKDRIMESHNLESIENTISMFYNRKVNVLSIIIDNTDKELEKDINNLEKIFKDDLSIQ